MTINRWLSPITSDKNPLFNGIHLIPIILTVTLAFEVNTQEDLSLIAPTTYAESEQASEDEEVSFTSLYQSYLLSLDLIDYDPYNPYSGIIIKWVQRTMDSGIMYITGVEYLVLALTADITTQL